MQLDLFKTAKKRAQSCNFMQILWNRIPPRRNLEIFLSTFHNSAKLREDFQERNCTRFWSTKKIHLLSADGSIGKARILWSYGQKIILKYHCNSILFNVNVEYFGIEVGVQSRLCDLKKLENKIKNILNFEL